IYIVLSFQKKVYRPNSSIAGLACKKAGVQPAFRNCEKNEKPVQFFLKPAFTYRSMFLCAASDV
ncbi:MAG TPA: hypothetical protein VN417_02005, partial [Candidatus Cryosericum sp.]|nr:hypothetical protein [Candidatus Cryosericum sp.]